VAGNAARDGDVAGMNALGAASGRVVYAGLGLAITRTAAPAGLILAGQVDEDSQPALETELARLPPAAELHFDLAGLQYCELAALRAIIALTGTGAAGRRVVLHKVPRQLLTVLAVLGWDATSGLIIVTG